MYDRKNNPDINIGATETIDEFLSRISEHFSKLEWQSEGHRMWYTHKNPYSCWICELLQVGRSLEGLLMDFRHYPRQDDANTGVELKEEEDD